MNLKAGPNVILPYKGRPGCMDAIRVKLAALTGCLAFVLERGLWVLVGAVIGVMLVGDRLTPSLLSVLGSVLGFMLDRLPWVVLGVVIGVVWVKRRRRVMRQ